VSLLFIVAVVAYVLAAFFWVSGSGRLSPISEWWRLHGAWRFARANPRMGPPIILPDITAGELINRLMIVRNTPDDGSLEMLKVARQIGQEIGDQVSLRHLSTWMRAHGSLDKVPHSIAKTGFGVGRDAAGNIYCLKVYPTGPDSSRNVTDIRFNLSEIRKVWPDV